jgi:plastocyanin
LDNSRANLIPWRSHDAGIRITISLTSLSLCITDFYPSSAFRIGGQLATADRRAERQQGPQALAFFSNEIWIHSGDSITWAFPSNEVHTVTFLTPGLVRRQTVERPISKT